MNKEKDGKSVRLMQKTPPPSVYTSEYLLRHCGGYKEYLKGEIAERIRRAFFYLDPHPNELILDAGCGRGEVLRQCKRMGCNAVGVDYSLASMNISKRLGIVIRASVTHMPFRDEVFDATMLLEVIEHLDKKDTGKCLREIKRVLKRGGRVIVSTGNRWYRKYFFPLFALYFRIRFRKVIRLDPFVGNKMEHYYLSTMHVDEKSIFSLWHVFFKNHFKVKVWFDEPLSEFESIGWRKLLVFIFFLRKGLWCLACKR